MNGLVPWESEHVMNIEFQTCGLAILCVLFFFHISRETAGFHGTKLYGLAMLANFLCLVLDITSIAFITKDQGVLTLPTEIICRLYLISLLWLFYLGLLYTANDINILRKQKLVMILILAFVIIGTLLALFLPISIYQKGRIAYSYGPAVTSTFYFAPTLILGTLFLTILFHKRMNSRRRMAVQSWMIIETAAGVLQFIFPTLLIIGFATAIGMMILFMMLENPERELDRTVDAFSTHILHDYVRQLYADHKPFCGALILNGAEWPVGREEENAILQDMAAFLKKIPKAKVFRATGYDFAIIMPIKYYSEDVMREIYERFVLSWHGYEIPSRIIAVPDNRVAGSPDEVTQFYHHYRSRLETSDERLMFMNEKKASVIRAVKLIHQEIASALDEDRVEVFYQPIYSIAKKRFVSAEALARIRKKDGTIMMPGEFIPIAEETGLIEDIGTRVLEQTCKMLHRHPITEIGVEYIEVNLSVSQCENRWLAEDIEALIARYTLSPSLLNLEITETSSIRFRDTVIANMEKMTKHGFSFSLDDFGTGESNLNYIVDMPVQIIKFDRTMTQDYFKNDRTRLVMDSIIKMVQNMHLKIVVEGIETKEQLETMEKLGVDYIQGYYFSKPIPLNEFITFIHKKNAATL